MVLPSKLLITFKAHFSQRATWRGKRCLYQPTSLRSQGEAFYMRELTLPTQRILPQVPWPSLVQVHCLAGLSSWDPWAWATTRPKLRHFFCPSVHLSIYTYTYTGLYLHLCSMRTSIFLHGHFSYLPRLAHGGELCEVSRAWRWPASWGYTGGLGMPKRGYPIDIPGISQRQGANHFRLVFSGYGEFLLLKDL